MLKAIHKLDGAVEGTRVPVDLMVSLSNHEVVPPYLTPPA